MDKHAVNIAVTDFIFKQWVKMRFWHSNINVKGFQRSVFLVKEREIEHDICLVYIKITKVLIEHAKMQIKFSHGKGSCMDSIALFS